MYKRQPYILVNYENEQLQTVPTVETNNEYLNTQQIKDEQGKIIDFTNMEPTILIPEQYYEVYMKEEYHHQQICAYEEQNCRVMKIKDGQETIPLRADENMKEGKIQNAIFSNHPLNSSNIYLHQTERKEVEKYLKTIEITDYEFYTMEETSESMMKGLEESIVIAIKHFMIYGGLSILALIQFIVTETQMRKRRIAVEHFHGVPMMVSFRTIIGSIIVSDVIGVMVSGIILKDYFSWVLYLKEMWIVVVVIYMAIELLIVMKSIQYQGRESIQALLKGEE